LLLTFGPFAPREKLWRRPDMATDLNGQTISFEFAISGSDSQGP
jgi:hypothetical protein